ncbi:MAG: MerR family transcriptional regulator [Fibrobacteres bacterium]|nr:MerR family transcriptional regulator [Fibrobacterota bacterium]
MNTNYLTSGQIAQSLRVSISTLKRWIDEECAIAEKARNANGWRLFTEEDLEKLKNFKKTKRRMGRQFRSRTLTPVVRVA